mmetsp:Transcript_28346/g.94102  ORF Transcript_28346/g.94102 Transcript_28346/m.94102 type:complete len:98 (+) Transcript_28346:239-532(+)
MKNLNMDLDEFKRVGGTEVAPMSTTTSEDIPKFYAKSEVPMIFKYTIFGLKAGVSIQFLSAYPHEEEYFYLPLTMLTYQRDYEDDGMCIIVLQPVMS